MPTLAFFGSSLVSAWWNGAATYYRGVIAALHRRGVRTTFYEPDAFDRQQHRDLIGDPEYARVVVYGGGGDAWRAPFAEAVASADVVVKASGVGVFDRELEAALAEADGPARVFWDVDAPATLDRIDGDPADHMRRCVPRYDAVLTYGGGPPVVAAYERLRANRCVPVYNAHDPATHHPVPPDDRFACDLAFLGNRLPDREARVRRFLFEAAEMRPDMSFLLGGNGWEQRDVPPNVRVLGHVGTADHNALNRTPRAVLNVSRESMARYGHSPATRVFEAAAAGATIITDNWTGIGDFFEPGREILVADGPEDVVRHLDDLPPGVGDAARRRALADHTYDARADDVLRVFADLGVAA